MSARRIGYKVKGSVMVEAIILGVIALGLLGYLGYVLLHPERL